MTKQMRAERERRQTVLEAQAHKESVVSRAEGDKQAKLLDAEAERDAKIALAKGQAEAIRLVYEAEAEGLRRLAESGVNENILRLKSIEAMKDVADGRATKIFIPNNLAEGVGPAAIAGEAFWGATKEPKKEFSNDEAEKIRKERCVKKTVSEDACMKAPRTKVSMQSAMTNAGMVHDMHKDETD